MNHNFFTWLIVLHAICARVTLVGRECCATCWEKHRVWAILLHLFVVQRFYSNFKSNFFFSKLITFYQTNKIMNKKLKKSAIILKIAATTKLCCATLYIDQRNLVGQTLCRRLWASDTPKLRFLCACWSDRSRSWLLFGKYLQYLDKIQKKDLTLISWFHIFYFYFL